MVKQAPEVTRGENRLDGGKFGNEAHLKQLALRVSSDRSRMSSWHGRLKFWWERYYGYANRDNGGVPWPGASEVYYTMSREHGNKVKSPLHGMLFAGPKVATMRARSATGTNKDKADIALENMLRGGGVTAIPDTEQQVAYGFHDMMWSGLCVWRPHWAYNCALRTVTLQSNNLPDPLDKLVVLPHLADEDRAALLQGDRFALMEYAKSVNQPIEVAAKLLGLANAPDVLQWLGVPQPLNRAAFKQARAAIEQKVIQKYNLDVTEPVDEKALEKIMAWMAAGFPGDLVLRMKEVLRDGPAIRTLSLFDFWLPAGARVDLTRTSRVTERAFYTESELISMAAGFDFNDKALEIVLDKSRLAGGIPQGTSDAPTHNAAKGLTFSRDSSQDLYEIYWTYEYQNIHGSRVPELMVTIWGKDATEIPLKAKEDDSPRGRMPYVVGTFNHDSPGFFDQVGLPEELRDPESYYTAMLRHLDNNMTLTNGPFFTARKTNFIDPETFQPMPGAVIGITRPDDFGIVNAPNNLVPLQHALALFGQWPEKMIGTVDIAATQPDRLFEPRTQLEVGSIIKTQQGMVAMRGSLARHPIRLLFQMCWDLLQLHAPDNFWISTLGEPAQNVTRQEIQGDYDVVLEAAVGDMDPNYRYQRALVRFQMLNDMSRNPVIAQDLRYTWDLAQAAMDVLNWDDPTAVARLVIERPVAQQEQLGKDMQARAQALAQMRAIAEKLALNFPTDAAEAALFMQRLKAELPHAGFQKITASAEEAEALVQQAAAVLQEEQQQAQAAQGGYG